MLSRFLTPDRVKVVGFTNGKDRYEEGSVIGNVLFIQDFMTLDFLKKFLSAYYKQPISLGYGDPVDFDELRNIYTDHYVEVEVPTTSKEFKEAKANGYLPDHMEKWVNKHDAACDTFFVSLWEMTYEDGCEYYSGRQVPVLFGVYDEDNEVGRTSFAPQALRPWGFSFKGIKEGHSGTDGSYFLIGEWNGYKEGNPWNHSPIGCVEGMDAHGNGWLESKNISKEYYTRVFHEFLDNYRSSDGCTCLTDILNGDEYIDDILPKVGDYLDKHCNNGHFNRWTSFGNGLYSDAEELVDALLEEIGHMKYCWLW